MINVLRLWAALFAVTSLSFAGGCRRSPSDSSGQGGTPVSVRLTVSVAPLRAGLGASVGSSFRTGESAACGPGGSQGSAAGDSSGAGVTGTAISAAGQSGVTGTATFTGEQPCAGGTAIVPAGQSGVTGTAISAAGQSGVTGKAIAAADQDKIASLQIFQYSSAGSGGRLLSRSRYLTFESPSSGAASYSFMARSAAGSRFVVIANSPEILDPPGSYNEAIASGYRFGENPASRLDSLQYLPMSGVTDPVDVGSSSGAGQSIPVTLVRLFARIDVDIRAGGEIAPDFRIRRVQVKNLPVTMLYLWTGAEPTSVPMFDATAVELPGQGAASWTGSFCVPENRQGEDPYVNAPMEKYGNGKPSATYIEVTGDHVTDGGSSVDRYLLRLYPGANATTDYNIERGGLYTVEATLTALDPADKRLTSSIPWFDRGQITLGGAGDSRTVKVHWSGKPFTVRTSDLPAWLSVSPVAGGVEGTQAGTTEVTFTATEYNITGLDRECTVTLLREGTAVGTLKVTQLSTLFILDSPADARITWPGASTAIDQATVQFRNTTFTATLMGEDAAHFEIVNARDVYGAQDGIGAYTFQIRPREAIQVKDGKSAQLVLTPTAGQGNNLIQPVTVNLVHNVNFKKPSNCFMIAPGESFSFDATKAGNDDAGTSTWSQALNTKLQSVALLWQTAADGEYSKESGGGELVLGTGSDIVVFDPDTRVVTVNTNKRAGLGGNAVVAAYDGPNGTGNILWSWHVWVTNYNPSEIGDRTVTATNQKVVVSGGEVHTYGVEYQKVNKGKVIMDRNLGAVKTYNYGAPPAGDNSVYKMWGYFWQSGRKDPFPQNVILPDGTKGIITLYDAKGSALSLPSPISGPVTLETSIRQPLVFISIVYASGKTAQSWESTKSRNLWAKVKTLYDPCPRGWRVPEINTWKDFTGKDSGFSWGENLYGKVISGQGTFPLYIDGKFAEKGTSVTAGRLYRDGISTTPNPRPISWYPANGYIGNTGLARNEVGGMTFNWSCSDGSLGPDGTGTGIGSSGTLYDLNARQEYFGWVVQTTFGLGVRCVQE